MSDFNLKRSASRNFTHGIHKSRKTLGTVLAGSILLSGCAPIASVEPAADAANPLCAEMMVVMPQFIDEYERRTTNSQATSAWGDPAKVILRCGVPVPPPTTDPCVTVNGVDWIAREGDDGVWTLTTYGRTPATEVVLNPQEIPSSTVLATLTDAAAKIPAQKKCLSVDKDVELKN